MTEIGMHKHVSQWLPGSEKLRGIKIQDHCIFPLWKNQIENHEHHDIEQ